MEADLERSIVTSIFPKNTSVLLCAPSRSGKTSFVHFILQNKNLYFGDNYFDKVLIISCNSKIEIVLPEITDLTIESCYLEEFDLNQVEEGTGLIFDDVSQFSNKIGESLNVALHHLNLPFVAVLVHSVLGSDLFRLASICHRIIFFLRSTSSARSAAYLISKFFRDRETRLALEKVLGYCQKANDLLLVCLNRGADEKDQYLALSKLSNLTRGYCLAHLGSPLNLSETALEHMAVKDSLADAFEPENFPPNTCVLVPTELVLEAKKNLPSKASDHSCTKVWNLGVKEIESSIEAYFKVAH
jgi:hypothetical protein